METPPILTDPFWVGAWRVEPSLNRIAGPAGEVQLEPRVMDVLGCLAAHAGAAVTRETLLETVWAGVVVGDDPLNRAISTLRKHFGDDPRSPAYIETIRKVGYRLIAPIGAAPQALPDTSAVVVAPGAFGGDGSVGLAAPQAAGRAVPTAAVVGVLAVVLAAALWLARDRGETPAPGGGVPLTSLPGHEVDPALSPGGDRVAYAWDGEGPFSLYVRTIAEAPPLRLTSGDAEDRSPAWSPDGQRIAFVRTEGDRCSILTVPALGGRPRRLAACVDASGLAWGAGGLLAVADRPEPDAPPRILLLDPERSSVRPLTLAASSAVGDGAAGDHSPAFSPDGTQIAFVRSDVAGLDRILTVGVEGGTPRARTSEPQRLQHLAWPEPDALVYSSDVGGTFAIYRRSLSSGTARWLAGGGDVAGHPTVRGGLTVYEERLWDKNIWAAPLDGSPPRLHIASTRWDHSPDVAADGRTVFISNRTGTYEVWLWSPETERAEALTRIGGPIAGRPRWHPDGQRVAFDVRSRDRSDVYVLELDAREPRRITGDGERSLHAAWSPDGRWLYYASDRGGSWQVWREPTEGGPAEPVTDAGGSVSQVSPDGLWLYVTKPDTPGLWRRPLAGGPESLVTDRVTARGSAAWTVAPEGVYLLTHEPDGEMDASVLLRLDPETGETTEIARPIRPVVNLGLALSEDGQSLLFVQEDQSGADLMMVQSGE